MPITFDIDTHKNWIEVTLAGEVTMEEAASTMRNLFAHPDYSDDYPGVIDCREMTNVLKVTDLRGLAEMQLARPGPAWRSKRAVVVSLPEQYSTARVFMLFAESGPVQYSVFYNMDSALQWVRE